MLLQILKLALSFAEAFTEPRLTASVRLSRRATRKAERKAQHAAEAAMTRLIEQGSFITPSDDGLRIFGQYGLIKKPDGRLFALHWDGGTGYEPHEQLSIEDREAALFHYCRYALSSIALSAARQSWNRTAVQQSINFDLRLPMFERLADDFLIRHCFGARWRAVIEPHVQTLFDDEVYALTTLSCPAKPITLMDYNRVQVHLTEWRSVRQQAPAMLPLVGWAYAHRLVTNPANLLGDTRAWLLGRGMTPVEWKLLCRLSPAKMRLLLAKWDAAGETLDAHLIRFARHWVAVGITPTSGWLRRYLRTRRAGLMAPAWFDQAAVAFAKKLDEAARKDFLRNRYANALDWLREYLENGHAPDANQRKQGWAWIQRQSDQWHREVLHRPTDANKTWQSLVAAYDDGPYRVIPLTSSKMLVEEGKRMHHCVGRKYYAKSCVKGESRIFSIEKNDARISTVQLVRQNRHWVVYQNNGIANRTPEGESFAVARRLAERYTRAGLNGANGVPAGKGTPAPSGH